ncbi:hypothetical protein EDB83DRAFT_2675300 [Lactarius deliciosus]|nr:hypothetical protein EDB83DRAFT_2675300 [Lactarius deliciosus]
MRQARRRFALRAGAISSSDDTLDDLVFGGQHSDIVELPTWALPSPRASAWMTHRCAPPLDQERGEICLSSKPQKASTPIPVSLLTPRPLLLLDRAGRTGEEVGAVAKIDADALAGAAAGSPSPDMPAARTRPSVSVELSSTLSVRRKGRKKVYPGRKYGDGSHEPILLSANSNPPGPLALRLAPALVLLDWSVAAPSRVVRIRHEKYGGEPVDVELIRLLLRLSEACSDAADGTSPWRRKTKVTDIIKRRPTSDLELVFKDDAGVTHKSTKSKDSILIRWNFDMFVSLAVFSLTVEC